MAKQQLLTLESIDNYYFDGCTLLGVQSSLTCVQFCWSIERNLGIDFHRMLTNDIAINFNAGKNSGLGIAGTLFEDIPKEELVHFALYEHKLSLSDKSIFVYQNQKNGYSLMPEYNQYHYLILIQDDCYMLNQCYLIDWLRKLDSIKNCHEININSLGKSKENLII